MTKAADRGVLAIVLHTHMLYVAASSLGAALFKRGLDVTDRVIVAPATSRGPGADELFQQRRPVRCSTCLSQTNTGSRSR
jgi:hypothetical protein